MSFISYIPLFPTVIPDDMESQRSAPEDSEALADRDRDRQMTIRLSVNKILAEST